LTDVSESPRPSKQEEAARFALRSLFERRPIPDADLLDHLELFLRPQRIAELLALSDVYQRILDVHGVVMEFGVRWGRHLSVFSGLRATLEPSNFYRRIVGFDTFAGFKGVDVADGLSARVHEGAMSVTSGYEAYLGEVLALHELESPLSHIRRFELCKGDAPAALEAYLEGIRRRLSPSRISTWISTDPRRTVLSFFSLTLCGARFWRSTRRCTRTSPVR